MRRTTTQGQPATQAVRSNEFPTGALQYGEEGTHHVWDHSITGRHRYSFSDEYLAQRFAVSVGSMVAGNAEVRSG